MNKTHTYTHAHIHTHSLTYTHTHAFMTRMTTSIKTKLITMFDNDNNLFNFQHFGRIINPKNYFNANYEQT